MTAPFISLPLNRQGQVVTKASAVVEISYKELKKATSTIEMIAYKAIDYFRSISPTCCSCCTHRSIKVIKEIDLNPLNPDTDLMGKIEELQTQHPLDFTCNILDRTTHSSSEPEMTLSMRILAEEIESLLRDNKISTTPDHIKRIVLARDTALRFQKTHDQSIICIPSKSDFFYDINPPQKAENTLVRSIAPKSPGKSLASVRVFPSGSSSITIPLLERLGGGLKILNHEIYIGPDNSISLMRRIKLRKNKSEMCRNYITEIMLKVIKFTHPGILIPNTLYLHPKKGLEYLVEDCKMDFFTVLEPYAHLQRNFIDSKDPMATHIENTQIAIQIRTHLSYMKAITVALKYMHTEGLLHNDLKPDNILLSKKESPLLWDFDFSCTLENARTLSPHGGSRSYKDPTSFEINLKSELFALARTFWMDNLGKENNLPSFIEVFESLHTLSQTKNPELSPHIELVITSLKNLCRFMRKGTPVLGGTIYPTLDTVIDTIEDLERKFPAVSDLP